MGKVKIILLVISTFITLDASVVQNPLVDRNLRIVGGTAARAQQFPHAVGLILYLINNNDSFCGGSIIHPTFILTVSEKT